MKRRNYVMFAPIFPAGDPAWRKYACSYHSEHLHSYFKLDFGDFEHNRNPVITENVLFGDDGATMDIPIYKFLASRKNMREKDLIKHPMSKFKDYDSIGVLKLYPHSFIWEAIAKESYVKR